MRRKIYDKMLEWKSENGQTALLIQGARRVGKSYIAEQFAKREYKSYILIDFNDISEEVLNLIVSNLSDRDRFFNYLQITFGVTLYERNSLIIFDEVQLCPKVRSAIKYLVADGRYDYIETGSQLSIKENVSGIVIPSEEESMNMYPMDFEEYMWAASQEKLMNYIKDCFNRKVPLEEALHRKAMTFFREYMIVGGMPQAVQTFLDTSDFNKVDKAKSTILSLYRADIAKHASKFTLKAESIFDAVPSQLSKHEKRFSLASISEDARMRDYQEPFMWLSDAMIVNVCFNSTEPNIGLKLNEDRTTFKCYMADTGLLITHTFGTDAAGRQELYRKLILDKLEVNEGMFVENVVSQMLKASGHNLFFFSDPSRTDAASRMEIDFLIGKSDVTSRHNISPIEVKSGARYTLSSLNKFAAKFPDYLSAPYVIHKGGFKQEGGITFLPLYMTPML